MQRGRSDWRDHHTVSAMDSGSLAGGRQRTRTSRHTCILNSPNPTTAQARGGTSRPAYELLLKTKPVQGSAVSPHEAGTYPGPTRQILLATMGKLPSLICTLRLTSYTKLGILEAAVPMLLSWVPELGAARLVSSPLFICRSEDALVDDLPLGEAVRPSASSMLISRVWSSRSNTGSAQPWRLQSCRESGYGVGKEQY